MLFSATTPRLTEQAVTAVSRKCSSGAPSIAEIEIREALPDELLSELCDAWSVRRDGAELDARAMVSGAVTAVVLGSLDVREAKTLLLCALLEGWEQ